MNPLMQGMASTSGGFNSQAFRQVKQMIGAFKSMQNPQAALSHIAKSNPQIASVMQMCSGKNPQEVFNQQCREHGMDPNDAIKQIQAIMNS